MSDAVTSLTMEERAAYYRKMALDAMAHAQAAQDAATKDKYVHLAKGWHALAVQIEDGLARAAAETFAAKPANAKR